MTNLSEGQETESSKMYRLEDGIIPEDKIVTSVAVRPSFFNRSDGMTEEDLERLMEEQAGDFNAYIPCKGPSPQISGINEMHTVMYLQLEDKPADYLERIGNVHRKLVYLDNSKMSAKELKILSLAVKALVEEFPERYGKE